MAGSGRWITLMTNIYGGAFIEWENINIFDFLAYPAGVATFHSIKQVVSNKKSLHSLSHG